MLVQATKLGYYGVLRYEGDVFAIEKEEHFGSWMKKADGEPDPAPEPVAVQQVEKLPVSGMGLTLEEAIKIAIDNGDVNGAGEPLVTKLKELTGRNITAEQRDEVINGGVDQ